jgi:hypothetical protein
MRIDDFDSEWHFVPDHPEALPRFRRTNRTIILIFAVLVLGVFVATVVSPPARNSVSAMHPGATLVQKAKALSPQHPAAPGPQSR